MKLNKDEIKTIIAYSFTNYCGIDNRISDKIMEYVVSKYFYLTNTADITVDEFVEGLNDCIDYLMQCWLDEKLLDEQGNKIR